MNEQMLKALEFGARNATLLLGQVGIAALLALMVIRLLPSNIPRWPGVQSGVYRQLALILLFGVMAVIDDWTSPTLALDLKEFHLVERDGTLQGKAIISLRDTIATVAGLAGGVWVGFGTGLVAGLHRLYLYGLDTDAANHVLCGIDLHITGFAPSPKAGLVPRAAAFGCVILGLGAGLVRQRYPEWARQPIQAMAVGFVAIIIYRLIIYGAPLFGDRAVSGECLPFDESSKLALSLLPIKLVSGVAGCLAFAFVMQMSRQLAEQLMKKDVLQAQMRTHFLTGVLGHIKKLMSENVEVAGKLIDDTIGFYKEIMSRMGAEWILLGDEYNHAHKYLQLWKSAKEIHIIDFRGYGLDEVRDFKIPPFTLLTLVDNSLEHGFIPGEPLLIEITARKKGGLLKITVEDNGKGFKDAIIGKLGNNPVEPGKEGSGKGLYYLPRLLQKFYVPPASMDCDNREDGRGARVTLKLPFGV